MAQTSSTSSSKQGAAVWWTLGLLWLAGLAVVGSAGRALAHWAASRWGETITQVTQGKVMELETFFLRMQWDSLFLSGGTLLLIWAAVRMAPCFGLAVRIAGLVLLPNLWLLLAGQTLMYWMMMQAFPLTNGTYFGRYQFKETLYRMESAPAAGIVIAGSSQARAQMDEELLDRLLPGVRVSELSFPGTGLYDLPFTYQRLSSHRPEVFLLYLSERDAYATPQVSRTIHLVSTRSRGWLLEPAAGRPFGIRETVYAGLGSLVPLFRHRQFYRERMLGTAWAELRIPGLRGPVLTPVADRYADQPIPTANRWGLEKLVDLTKQHGTRLFIIRGMLHPEINQQLLNRGPQPLDCILERVASLPHVTVYDHRTPFPQTNDMYVDRTHVNDVQQERFTRHLAEVLVKHDFSRSVEPAR